MVAEGFFAEDLFHHAATPGFASAWRLLQLGDPEGAAFFAEGLEDGVALAQLRAAIAVAQGDLAAAGEILDAALAALSDSEEIADVSVQRGVIARERREFGAARDAFARAAALKPGRAATWAALARAERSRGDTAAARAVLDDALARHPGDADLHAASAAWYLGEKRYAEALAECDAVAACDASAAAHPFALANRGNALLGLRRFDAADATFAEAQAADPAMFEAIFGRAIVALDRGDLEAAEAGLARALEIRPRHRDAKLRRADALTRMSRHDDAEAQLEVLIAEDPRCFDAHYQLAALLHGRYRYDEAEDVARRALALRPDFSAINDLLGLTTLNRGKMRDALDCFARAGAPLGPSADRYAENHLYALHYDPECSAEEVFAAHCAFGERFGGRGEDPAWRLANPPDPERRLRIGYVSPDFRAHSVMFFAMALFAEHDRRAFEVFAYGLSSTRDRVTEWLIDTADHWCDASWMTPAELRARVADDGIDILVDLAGHTGNNGLSMLRQRAAPVQVNYIGYPDTTGMPGIDYRIVDAITDPPGAEAFATETLVRLPRAFLAYRLEPDRPAVGPGPIAADKPFTFGTFNTALKLNDRVFDAWAEILRAVPEARLFLKANQFASAAARAWVEGAFAARGVDIARIALRGFARTLGSHLEMYNELDLALDTFPYNGTTTTCEALSVGAPVLGLKGDRHCARVGESLLAAAGLADDFLADSVEDYVRRAVAWAGRRAELSALRPEVHRRFVASELCDAPGLTRAVEAAYREMWRTWCAEGPRCGLGPSRYEEEMAACARS